MHVPNENLMKTHKKWISTQNSNCNHKMSRKPDCCEWNELRFCFLSSNGSISNRLGKFSNNNYTVNIKTSTTTPVSTMTNACLSIVRGNNSFWSNSFQHKKQNLKKWKSTMTVWVMTNQQVPVEVDPKAIHHGKAKENHSKGNAVNWRVPPLTSVATVLVGIMKQ